ncbi:Uncharacterized protein OBRU01_16469 [Operophtera brumata]|uniref:Uncharacterized protein n=1 Tax=Operophtera brumata TaxID=104452 RepID=A0A0L7L2I4_OPEBR|nr:Uncharacterized protein OBRU01_16469 [Operophtera brumata]
MVNYRRVVCEVALLCGALSAITAAPACDHKHQLVYDQRQNGSENYRLNIDGVVIAVAPAESFLSALSDIDFSDLIDMESLEQELKPKPPTTSITVEDLPVPKPDEKPVLDVKPEDTVEAKPNEKPLESKPDSEDKPEAPSKLDDVSVEPTNLKGHKKSAQAQLRKQETTQR